MELLFVILIAAGIGFIVRYAIPGRETHGALLIGSVSAVVATVVWSILLWVGFTFDGGWIWVWSIAAAVAVSIATVLILPRKRNESDARLLAQLSGAKA